MENKPVQRRKTKKIWVGDVPVGGGSPVSVQSMTNTETTDVSATVKQVNDLEEAGADIVRISVPSMEAAESFKTIKTNTNIPLVSDIHFDYKIALQVLKYGVDCVRINPGNIGSEKKIKDIQLGDNTKGGEVTGVFQFKASDEIHDYKGVTVAGSHYVKEDGKFIMVQDSPLSVKIDKIPVVYSLDTTGRRIFIKDIEFADYNGDGVAKGFLANAGINVPEFNKEVLRQVAERLI